MIMPEEHKLSKYWKILYPLGFYLVMTNIIAILVMCYLSFLYRLENPGISSADLGKMISDGYMAQILLITFLSALFTLPFLIIFMHKDKERLKRLNIFKTYESAPLWGYGILILLGCFACIGMNNLIGLSGLIRVFSGYNRVAELLYQSNIPFEILATGIVIPTVEELLFRGLIYQRARGIFSFPIALLLSSAIFGLFHGNVVQGIYAFVLGIIFGYAYEKFKSIWAPIILHVCANCLSVVISETEIFTPIYENILSYLLLTGISVIAVTCALLLIEQLINLKEVKV